MAAEPISIRTATAVRWIPLNGSVTATVQQSVEVELGLPKRCLRHSFVLDASRGKANVTRFCHSVDFAAGLSNADMRSYRRRLTESRNGGNCEYQTAAPPSTANRPRSVQQNCSPSEIIGASIEQESSPISNHRDQRAIRPTFPPVFFLDAEIFHRAQLDLPLPELAVPLYVSDLVGGFDNNRQIIKSFVNDVHPWLPLISKNWAYNHLLNPLSPTRSDAILLLFSIRLVTWVPSVSQDPHTPVYIATKRFFRELETAGTFSIRFVQAGVLIALYELGHCIYPAAYTSVGLCARYAVVLGFDKDVRQGNVTNLPWDKLEERKRVWSTLR